MIFHLTALKSWLPKQGDSDYRAASLISEGFIHCSYREQVLDSAARHFSAETELLALHVEESRLGDALKVEPSREGMLFPHIYGPIPLSAVVGTSIVTRDAAGRFHWPGDPKTT